MFSKSGFIHQDMPEMYLISDKLKKINFELQIIRDDNNFVYFIDKKS